jgi:hypothetical protein
MGNLSHVLRRSDTSIAVSRLPHCVTGGVESCGSLLRRNFYIGECDDARHMHLLRWYCRPAYRKRNVIETSGRNLARYQWRGLHLATAFHS